MKQVDVTTQIVIAAPAEKVAAFASDPDNAPKWYLNIRSVNWKTIHKIELGAQIAFEARFLGRTLAYVYEIVEFQSGAKMVMQTADGPFPMQTTYTWEALDGNRTRMTLRNAGRPSGFSKLFAPLMTRMMRRANNKDLRLLKRIMERGE